jgi:hypothetical protein
LRCMDTAHARGFYTPFGCNLRFCPLCGPRLWAKEFRKYGGLKRVVQDLRSDAPNYVLAKLDITAVNLGRMPAPKEVRLFGRLLRKFRDRICKKLAVAANKMMLLRVLEFGEGNTNLHAHCLYCGPWLPQRERGGSRETTLELSDWWKEVCRGTVFAGSRNVSVKAVESFD